MKKGIHPDYKVIKFTDISSKQTFSIGSTLSNDIQVEVSSASHPHYTGEIRIIDTENKVDKFKKKMQKASKMKEKVENKRKKIAARRKSKVDKVKAGKTLTLKDMLKNM